MEHRASRVQKRGERKRLKIVNYAAWMSMIFTQTRKRDGDER
jgi:hypothetical protein